MGLVEMGSLNLAINASSRSSPVYVQYYVTARCNLRCEQCNVIFANADRRELRTAEAFEVLENLAALNTAVVLLTGGEPFTRSDLPKLAGKAIDLGIHPRIQTNGLASLERLKECAMAGARDISISLDSLGPSVQDKLNGGFENSWFRAIETISNVSEAFGRDTFGALGCVFSPYNFREVHEVIRFATEIGWWVSLVPAHATDVSKPRSFSTFNQKMNFDKKDYADLEEVIDSIIQMKSDGFHVYDSIQFLNDMKNFCTGKPITWRDRNSGACDAGALYFAVLPDGTYAPCCDWRLEKILHVQSHDFVKTYRSKELKKDTLKVAQDCSGCMYGSYPEISISARYLRASLERVKLFGIESRAQMKTLSVDELLKIAEKIRE